MIRPEERAEPEGARGVDGLARRLAAGGEPPVDEAERDVPLSALWLSLFALSVAALIGWAWPDSVAEYSGLVWLLALIPVFLLSYHRGWWGAALAALLSMVALTFAEVVLVDLMGRSIEWRMFGFATVILVSVTLGSGLLSEVLHQRNILAMKMAFQDPLTGLANRRMIERDGERVLARAEREGGRPAVLFFDLIRFKRVNDELGFTAGDEALTIVGRRIENALRNADTVARVGGDEFAALIPDADGEEGVQAVADRVKSVLWRPIKVGGQTLHLGARVGVATYPEDGEDFDALLSEASPGKREERGWAVPLRGNGEEDETDLVLERELVDALEGKDGLRVHYQPVARLGDDAVVGAEGLLRWEHPERGVLNAAQFVPAAERMGIIQELERVMLKQAVAQAARWADAGLPIWTSVNLSLTSLEGEGGRETLTRLAREHDLPPGRLVVEVTERVTARNPAAARRHLEALREAGLRMAIDDFGTGHSSLAYFEQFPLDMVKVDRMFIGELARKGRKQRVVEAILGLARGLDLTVVAEGVETDEQRRWLRSSGCDLYQGHVLARARPAEELTRKFEEGELTPARSENSLFPG